MDCGFSAVMGWVGCLFVCFFHRDACTEDGEWKQIIFFYPTENAIFFPFSIYL